MADQKPVDSTQIRLDQKPSAPPGVGIGGLVFKVIAILFVIGNVTALYVLHFVNRPSPTTRFSFSNFEAVTGTHARVGDVVSLSADSKLRNGAGTTAYLDRATIQKSGVSYYEYVNLAKLGVSNANYLTNLMSYRRAMASSTESVLTTFTVDPATKIVTISDAYDANNVLANEAIRGIATLSDSSALVLSLDTSAKVWVRSAKISGTTGATLSPSSKMLVTTSSATNFVTRLSTNTALVAYYDAWVQNTDYYQNVKVAVVGTDGTVTLSASQQFGPANNDKTFYVNWGKPVTISSTANSFVIPYYTPISGLCVTMSSYSSTTNKVDAFTTGVCNTNFKPTYYPEGIMLSDNILLLAFHDTAKNNVLTVATVQVTATAATFRSYFVIPEVAGDYDFGSNSYGYSPELSIALLSGNRVAVSFMNPSMNGRQSIKVLKYSIDTLSFKDVTPVLPLAPASFTFTTYTDSQHDRPVTQQILSVGTDSVVAMHMGNRGDVPHQRVSLVEVFGAPIGVLRKYNGKRDASVAISGKAKDIESLSQKSLVEGQFYYATTSGSVTSPDSTGAAGADYFASSEDSKVLVTTDSKIGVATDKHELFVSTAL